MAWSGVVTNAGEQLIQAAVGGSTLVFTSVNTGSGNSENMRTATALNSPVATGSMTGQIETNGVRIRMKIPPYTSQYTMREIGIYAKIDNGLPVLFALMQDATGIAIPDEDDFPDFVYNMATFISISNTDSVSITVDPTASVSESEFEEALGNVVELDRDFYTNTSSVSVPLSADQKTRIVYCCGSSVSGIMDSVTGAFIFVSNGKYGVIHKGSGINVAVNDGSLVVSCATAINMAVIEI